uniref:Glycerol-3-phosphate dehydrogenase n=1 Tax=Oryza meridionalis TaxID=40149 RepID=A0A0E0DBM8_9ORYZ
MATWRLRRAAAAIAASSAVVAAGAAWPSASASDPFPAALEAARRRVAQPGAAPPPRAAQRAALAGSTPADPLDVLVVGGGATGCGVALDAATRGLRVGLVEREDFSSGTSSRSTKLIHGDESVELFPTLAKNSHDRSLRGTVVYYDGQMNDSRLNVGLACTAAVVGAAILNYAEVVSLIKDESGERIIGARIRDTLSGKEFDAFAKVVVNAAGPFCDSVRKMANNDVVPMISPSSGVHIVLPDYYSPDGMGLIVPKTKDGRVVFMLPWLGRTVAGTTDSSTAITMLPEPHEDEIQFILDAICDYLNVQVRRSDVLSAWSGIRPLAMDPSAKNTESISRDHVVFEDYPGLITITGGKWTTYRSMAEDAVNAAIRSGNLKPANGCVTDHLHILGGYGWDPASFTVLAQNYKRMKRTYGGKIIPGAMDSAVSKHLSHAYGTLATQVASIAQNEGLGKRLAHGYPFLEAEVAYCARHEYCESAVDFIARRCRLAFLDTDAAGRALPRIIEILALERKWDKARQKLELQKGKDFLETFKSSKNAQFRDGKHNGQ